MLPSSEVTLDLPRCSLSLPRPLRSETHQTWDSRGEPGWFWPLLMLCWSLRDGTRMTVRDRLVDIMVYSKADHSVVTWPLLSSQRQVTGN